jgi:hypothetical protein
MLTQILEFVERTPDATSISVCEAFGLPLAMAERMLQMLEDAGHFTLEAAKGCSGGCSSGGCSSGGCSSGGCGTVTSTLNALADAARERKKALA